MSVLVLVVTLVFAFSFMEVKLFTLPLTDDEAAALASIQQNPACINGSMFMQVSRLTCGVNCDPGMAFCTRGRQGFTR